MKSIDWRYWALCLGLAFQAGCAGFPEAKDMDWSMNSWLKRDKKAAEPKPVVAGTTDVPVEEEEIEYGDPVSLAVIWVDSTFTGVGARATRGFGGRFFFYDVEGAAVPVEGELIIYGFDDSTDAAERKVPDRKYVFKADELQKHRSKNDLGVSYSFWVPWDGVGGERKTISLLPMFRTTAGRIVRGEQSVNVLPGKTPESALPGDRMVGDRERSAYSTTQVGYAGDDGVDDVAVFRENQSSGLKMRTATIHVPSDLSNQLLAPQTIRRDALSRYRVPQAPTTPQPGVQVGVGTPPGLDSGGAPDVSSETDQPAERGRQLRTPPPGQPSRPPMRRDVMRG